MESLSRSPTAALRDFHLEARGGTKIWVHRCIADQKFVDQIADCDHLLDRPECQIIKDQKKIKVGRLNLKIAGRERHLYIKRYNAFSLRYRLGSLVSCSGAVKSLKGATVLRDAGVHTPNPMAAVENRVKGILTKSFFVTEEIHGAKTADAYWLDDLSARQDEDGRQRRQNFLRDLASLFRSLHAQQIYHNDLKDANILVVSEPDHAAQLFFLLDLEGVKRFARLSDKRRIKNLVQLNRTLGRYVCRSDKLSFMKSYLGSGFFDRGQKRRLIQQVVSESDRLDALKNLLSDSGHTGIGAGRA